MKKIDRIRETKPFREFTEADASEQVRHLTEDDWLYQEGKPRYICSLLGAIYEELEHERPDLLPLVLEAVWMARRMNDRGKKQDDLDWESPGTGQA